jgi:hypothetical protein
MKKPVTAIHVVIEKQQLLFVICCTCSFPGSKFSDLPDLFQGTRPRVNTSRRFDGEQTCSRGDECKREKEEASRVRKTAHGYVVEYRNHYKEDNGRVYQLYSIRQWYCRARRTAHGHPMRNDFPVLCLIEYGL